MDDNDWKYLLLNGKYKQIQVKKPVFTKGILEKIDGLEPFNSLDSEGNSKIPNVQDANALKRQYYSDFFRKPFKNLLILSGAGSSMDVGGLSMINLWEESILKFGKDEFEEICRTVKHSFENKNLESLLSRIDGVLEFSGNIEIGKEKIKLHDVQETIFKLIEEKCSILRPGKDKSFPHADFLKKLLQRKQTNSRIKVFTLNYDLLFEFAATQVNAIVIDGFSFTIPRTFSGRFFDYDIVQREGSKLKDEDNFINRVFHLHKLHGSVDWEREDNLVIKKDKPKKPLMIYPRDAKYKDSYEQPFFEMMARFQRSLRLDNDTILICIGYSFNDSHVNAAIEEALNQNPGFRLAVIDPYFDNSTVEGIKKIIEEAKNSDRIMLASETFTDFAMHYPEIKTYDNEDTNNPISLKNEAK